MDDLFAELRRTNEVVGDLADALRQARNSNTQTVVHKTDGRGFIAGFAVAACIATLAFTFYIAKDLRDDLRDLKAWSEVLRGKVSAIEGKLNH
jgi:enoyl-CoA hydratase/carnithine racemase